MEYNHKISVKAPTCNIELELCGEEQKHKGVALILSKKHKGEFVEHLVVSKEPGVFARCIVYLDGEQHSFEQPIPNSKECYDLFFEMFPTQKMRHALIDGEYSQMQEEEAA